MKIKYYATYFYSGDPHLTYRHTPLYDTIEQLKEVIYRVEFDNYILRKSNPDLPNIYFDYPYKEFIVEEEITQLTFFPPVKTNRRKINEQQVE